VNSEGRWNVFNQAVQQELGSVLVVVFMWTLAIVTASFTVIVIWLASRGHFKMRSFRPRGAKRGDA
jgi:hypothetical protein